MHIGCPIVFLTPGDSMQIRPTKTDKPEAAIEGRVRTPETTRPIGIIVALVLILGAAACSPKDDVNSWDGEQLAPQGRDSRAVEAGRVGDIPVRVDTPILAAPYERLQIAADGTLYGLPDGDLDVSSTQLDLPAPDGLKPLVLARPVPVPSHGLIVAYNLIDEDAPLERGSQIRGQRLAMVLHPHHNDVYPIDLQDYGVEPGAVVRADLALHADDVEPRVYVGTGGVIDGGTAVGRVLAIDPDAWARFDEPVVAQFGATVGDSGSCATGNTRSDGACGGGLHGEAAIRVHESDDGNVDVILATGKGATNPLEGNFANGFLRLSRDLDFAPGCDREVCEASGGASSACLATCRSFFVPRAVDGESHVPDALRDQCSSEDAFACLRDGAFDGSSAPIEVPYDASATDESRSALVWAAPDGFLYALPDGDWSQSVSRTKFAHVCEAADPECDLSAHTPATTPELACEHATDSAADISSCGTAVVWIPSYSPLEGIAAGVSQFDVVGRPDGPSLLHLRSTPPRDHVASVTRFRHRPSRIHLGGVVESGVEPRLFRPFYYVNEDARGLDVRLHTDGVFVAAGYTRPVKHFDEASWYVQLPGETGSSLEGFWVRLEREFSILE